jgi:hypothetical protein
MNWHYIENVFLAAALSMVISIFGFIIVFIYLSRDTSTNHFCSSAKSQDFSQVSRNQSCCIDRIDQEL